MKEVLKIVRLRDGRCLRKVRWDTTVLVGQTSLMGDE